MTEMLIAPENETFPHRRRWTRQECERLVQIGFLTGRYELIDGEVIAKMGQNAPHTVAMMLLGQWLVSLFGYLFVRTEKPITVPGEASDTMEPEPDLAVTFAPTTDYRDRHPAPQDIRFVVEISDTTLNFDLKPKALLYARVGIPEYWVLDVNGRQLHRHRQPTHEGYAEVVSLTEADLIAAPSRTDTIRIGDLFAPSSNALP